MKTYRTFIRKAKNWKEFSSAVKKTVNTGLSYTKALQECVNYNANLTKSQMEDGVKMEFEME